MEPIVEIVISVIPYAFIRALVRISWGIYKAYSSFLGMEISYRRISAEYLASMMFGIFGGVLLSSVGMFEQGANVATLMASMLGASTIELIAKKFGWTRKMEVMVSDQQLGLEDLNMRQVNALEYAKERGSISKSEYQKLNATSNRNTRYELSVLVSKGKLRMTGSGRSTVYLPGKEKAQGG